MTGPPVVIDDLLRVVARDGAEVPTLMAIGTGGSATPSRLFADIDAQFGGRVAPGTGYGSTETTSAVFAISGDDLRRRPTSMGLALPTVEARIVPSEDGPHPDGAGELEIRGPQVADGYLNHPQQSAESFRDGWFRTGDLARQDEDGFFYMVGRLKDVIIRGGENVYAAEVEAALAGHPDVVEAAVIGRAHPTFGEEVCAVVRTQLGSALTEDSVAG